MTTLLAQLAERAAYVFTAGDDSPIEIRRAIAIHGGGDLVLVRWTCDEEREAEIHGSGTVEWTGPLAQWQAALRAALAQEGTITIGTTALQNILVGKTCTICGRNERGEIPELRESDWVTT